jgi:hypothetical protein
VRRAAVLAITLLTLACAATADAFPSAYLTFDPKTPGSGTLATLDMRLSRGWQAPRTIALRIARGTKVDPGAVARRCTVARAAEDDCPNASRIGGGKADVSVTSDDSTIRADIDLYLAPERRSGDIAGVVMVVRAAGIEHASGRVFPLDAEDYPRKGIQVTFEGVRRAFTASPSFVPVIRHLNVHFGAHRTLDGERVDLITNPTVCGPDGWPWTIGLEDNGTNFFHGSVNCSPL